MRFSERRDGSIEVQDDDNELLIVEPRVAGFTPGRNSRCVCGGSLVFRRATNGSNEIACLRCHGVFASLDLGARVHW
jgi:hypothetical protein